ncbi:MAG: hypothetical protein HQL82_11340 [Magnetococcales bacterium]|nr:hypothetical protein [Magnetococcales bacterium]
MASIIYTYGELALIPCCQATNLTISRTAWSGQGIVSPAYLAWGTLYFSINTVIKAYHRMIAIDGLLNSLPW